MGSRTSRETHVAEWTHVGQGSGPQVPWGLVPPEGMWPWWWQWDEERSFDLGRGLKAGLEAVDMGLRQGEGQTQSLPAVERQSSPAEAEVGCWPPEAIVSRKDSFPDSSQETC